MRLKLDHTNVFFASDLHFCHSNVIKYDGRPFDDVYEMNETLINNWNSVISDKDTVLYLGDLTFERNGDETKKIVDRLNGKIHYISGNHDDERLLKKLKRFETISDYINLSIQDEDVANRKQYIMMMHYAILQWDKAHHGSWMLHGHSHGSLMKDPNYDWYYKNKVLDIGCNMHDYKPLSYSQIKEYMKDKLIKGHH